jgi:hypothetical protein
MKYVAIFHANHSFPYLTPDCDELASARASNCYLSITCGGRWASDRSACGRRG